MKLEGTRRSEQGRGTFVNVPVAPRPISGLRQLVYIASNLQEFLAHRALVGAESLIAISQNIRHGKRAAAPAHRSAAARRVIRVAVFADGTVRHFGDQIAVRFVAPRRVYPVRAGQIFNQLAVCQSGIGEVSGWGGNLVQPSVAVVTVRIIIYIPDLHTGYSPFVPGIGIAPDKRLVINTIDRLGYQVEFSIICEGSCSGRVGYGYRLPNPIIGIGDIRRIF